MGNLWRWLFEEKTLWCAYRHHWVSAHIVGSRPTHYTHYWCRRCFDLWFDDDPLYWGTRIQQDRRAALLRWRVG
jgi:hypothetical protein